MQEAFATYLLNAVWQAPVVAVCALMISRFAGLSPQARSSLWLTFLVLAVALPATPLAALLPHARRTVALGQPGAPISAPSASAADSLTAAAPAIQLAPWSALAMTALVAAVALVLVARLLVASGAARRLVRQARPAVLPAEVAQALEELARAHGRTVPPVLRSADAPSPAVVGALRPVILIPETLAASDEDLRAALLHEMAHVLRHDYAVNLACEVLTLPVSWHPALIGIKAGVRRSRELACDAIAARAMTSQKAYARCLVSLAQTLSAATSNARAGAPVRSALAVGLFGRSDLEDRLIQLMKPRDLEGPFVRAARACGLAAVGAGVLGSAALLHVTPVFAQPAAEAPALAAKQAADQAQQDAAKPDPVSPRPGAIVSRGTVIVTSRHGGRRHTHSWTGADGRSVTVINDEPTDLSAEQQRRIETAARTAEAKAAEAEARVNSPEFKARIAAAEAKAAEAEARVNSPEFKARIAAAEAKAAAAEKMVNSPEFKAKIAMAQARADAAERRVNSPEFKARIARAEAAAARAEAEARAAELEARATP